MLLYLQRETPTCERTHSQNPPLLFSFLFAHNAIAVRRMVSKTVPQGNNYLTFNRSEVKLMNFLSGMTFSGQNLIFPYTPQSNQNAHQSKTTKMKLKTSSVAITKHITYDKAVLLTEHSV